jgi:thiamine monophosphate kinase
MGKGKAIIHDSESTLVVNYEDFDVECFGGGDYEVTYTLDKDNRQKLYDALKDEGLQGCLEEMILSHFGEYLDKGSFCFYCDKRNIKYELFTRVS